VGKGSAFHFTVSFELQQAPAERLIPAEPEKVHGLPVLVVDDNATNRRILEEMLRNWGMKPVVAEGGRSALAALEQAQQAGEPFRLVLVDARMPEMDGFTLAERIREHPEMNGSIIMLLSSSALPGQTARCRELGVADFLHKPIKQAELWKVILKALGKNVPLEESENRPERSVPRPRRCLRILLAEDNPVNQRLAVSLLEKLGHTVVVAGNGREAIGILFGDQEMPTPTASPATSAESPSVSWSGFDLVLMDVQMPEMDGLQATAAIRRKEAARGAHVPIIGLTAYAMKGDRERCLAAGMDGYVAKPIHRVELLKAIEAVVPTVLESEAVPGAEAPSGQVFDCTRALTEAGGDRQLVGELAALFLQECPKWLAEIHTAIAEGNSARLQLAAHTLKGACACFAAKGAVEAALDLEKMGREGELVDACEAETALVKQMQRLQPALAGIAKPTGNLAVAQADQR
jgi:CheY-like chemotaxis protein